MKFKGQGKINICGFEYKKYILQTAVGGGGGGGGSEHPKQKPVSAPAAYYIIARAQSMGLPPTGRAGVGHFIVRLFTQPRA